MSITMRFRPGARYNGAGASCVKVNDICTEYMTVSHFKYWDQAAGIQGGR
jgi:hypothetical protein